MSIDPATVPAADGAQPVAGACTPVVATLLAEDRRRGAAALLAGVPVDRARRGSVAARGPAGVLRRAEPGPCGPLVLEARAVGGDAVIAVWGDRATPPAAIARALADAVGWAGLADDPAGFGEVVGPHPLLRRLHREVGDVRLSRLPRIGEALGRAVLAQLVQAAEGHRSAADVAARVGRPAPHGLWCWPTAREIGSTPAWALRPCGVSLRGAQALHAGAVADGRLTEVGDDWALLDRRLRALPGVGVWTSAETRRARGDADAVSVGDYNLPALVGAALAPERPREAWDDALMVELLAPFAPHRARVIQLVAMAGRRGLVPRPARRGPRAAWSRHRSW